MKVRAKYKVGDRVTVPHVGECEVLKVVAFDGAVEYVLRRGNSVFSVQQNEIMEVAGGKEDCHVGNR